MLNISSASWIDIVSLECWCFHLYTKLPFAVCLTVLFVVFVQFLICGIGCLFVFLVFQFFGYWESIVSFIWI